MEENCSLGLENSPWQRKQNKKTYTYISCPPTWRHCPRSTNFRCWNIRCQLYFRRQNANVLAAILFSIRFATQSSRILRLETGKELLALGTNFSLLFLPIFAYFRKNKEMWRHTFFQNWYPPELQTGISNLALVRKKIKKKCPLSQPISIQ